MKRIRFSELFLFAAIVIFFGSGKNIYSSVLLMLASAYMTQKLLSEHTDIPGWEGYPVKLYEYYTGKDIKKE